MIIETKEDTSLEALRQDFNDLRHPVIGTKRILEKLEPFEAEIETYMRPWLEFSKPSNEVYPSQGVHHTDYDYLDCQGHQLLDTETVIQTLRVRHFFLTASNHPYRLMHLENVSREPFQPPPKAESQIFITAKMQGEAIAIGDLVAKSGDGDSGRVGRTERYAKGPFIKLGKQARMPFVGSENPYVWGTASSISTMAASHCIAAIPRNGLFHSIERQQDLARETFVWLDNIAEEILGDRPDKDYVLTIWKNNVVGTLEPTFEKAAKRAEALYKAGVRAFRIYSPEPGNSIVTTTKGLREVFGDEVEIFTGQVVSVQQAKRVNEAGADLIIVGIGGGGRCTTPLRSGIAVDWPELVWNLRGEINIPVVVQGGASEHVATTLLLGASGIGVSRAAAGGTIESPGGILFCVDSKNDLYNPYPGEAAGPVKVEEEKILPFGIPSFVEGETTKAYLNFIKHTLPTLTHNLHHLTEEVTLALVFQEVLSIPEIHQLYPSPLRKNSPFGEFQRNTH